MNCQDCHRPGAHVVGNGGGGHLWLCGDCEFLAANPDAEPARPMPRDRKSVPLQSERLFDVSKYVTPRKGARQ